MKYHHLVLSALLLGTGWSTNVVYEYQTGQKLWRGLASQEDKPLTLEKVSSHIKEMDERANEITVLHKTIKKSLESKKLKDLVAVRDQSIPKIKGLIEEHNKAHKKFSTFMDQEIAKQQEEKILEDIKNVSSIIDKVEKIKLEVISGDLNKEIKIALEKKAIAQSQIIDELSQSICQQNRKLSSITTKIEDLLEKQEKVFAQVEEEEEKVSNEQQALTVDPNLLFSAFASQFMMQPKQFFEMPSPTGLASESNPMGLDMNFLMMTQMLSQSSGFGPRSNINYAPVYNQQRSYFATPQMFNEHSFNQQQQPRVQGALLPGFNFTRGEGLVEQIPLNGQIGP